MLDRQTRVVFELSDNGLMRWWCSGVNRRGSLDPCTGKVVSLITSTGKDSELINFVEGRWWLGQAFRRKGANRPLGGHTVSTQGLVSSETIE